MYVILITIFNYMYSSHCFACLFFVGFFIKSIVAFYLGPLHVLKEIFPCATDDQLKVALEDNLNNVDMTVHELLNETNGKCY